MNRTLDSSLHHIHNPPQHTVVSEMNEATTHPRLWQPPAARGFLVQYIVQRQARCNTWCCGHVRRGSFGREFRKVHLPPSPVKCIACRMLSKKQDPNVAVHNVLLRLTDILWTGRGLGSLGISQSSCCLTGHESRLAGARVDSSFLASLVTHSAFDIGHEANSKKPSPTATNVLLVPLKPLTRLDSFQICLWKHMASFQLHPLCFEPRIAQS